MLCQECRYPLDRLAVNRCPECGRAFDPADESTFTRSSIDVSQRLSRPVRAAIVFAAFGLWYLATMRNATASTSWESHRFAGPFIIIKESLESHTASDWALALIVWAFFIALPVHWIVSGRTWSAIVTIALCVLALVMSDMAALAASC